MSDNDQPARIQEEEGTAPAVETVTSDQEEQDEDTPVMVQGEETNAEHEGRMDLASDVLAEFLRANADDIERRIQQRLSESNRPTTELVSSPMRNEPEDSEMVGKTY